MENKKIADKAKKLAEIKPKEDSRLEKALKMSSSEILAKAISDLLKRDKEE